MSGASAFIATTEHFTKIDLAPRGAWLSARPCNHKGIHYRECPLWPPKADIRQPEWHVRLVPCVDGSLLARAFWR